MDRSIPSENMSFTSKVVHSNTFSRLEIDFFLKRGEKQHSVVTITVRHACSSILYVLAGLAGFAREVEITECDTLYHRNVNFNVVVVPLCLDLSAILFARENMYCLQ